MVLGAAGGGIHQLFDLFLNGVILGAIYVLLALGLNVILGLIGVINFAHAAFYMLGAYLTLSFAPHIGFLPAVAAESRRNTESGLVGQVRQIHSCQLFIPSPSVSIKSTEPSVARPYCWSQA